MSCFVPLKKAYGRQIRYVVRNRVFRITKLEFLAAFPVAYYSVYVRSNIYGGFRGSRLFPFNLDVVLEKFDLTARKPSSELPTLAPWQLRT